MKFRGIGWGLLLGALTFSAGAYGQAPEGPMTPQPGVLAQQAPKIKVRSLLVSTPVTVRNTAGEMVNSLEAHDFRITEWNRGSRILIWGEIRYRWWWWWRRVRGSGRCFRVFESQGFSFRRRWW